MLPLIVWLVVVGLIIAGVVSLSGCAENRYLTKEEDDELRAQCEPQPQGCAVMPMHEWLQIEQILKRLSGQAT